MSARKASRNSSEGPALERIDHEGLGWALARIHEWRQRVDNRAKVNGEALAQQFLNLAQRGVQESLLGFVILGCEWMFRLRTSRPHDAEIVLARIERGLLPVLREHAWLVTEALAPSIRKLLKSQRVLAPEFEDAPRQAFVVTEPGAIGDRPYEFGYIAPLRTRPQPLIRARRGPPPKLAPWMVGAITERLLENQHGQANDSS